MPLISLRFSGWFQCRLATNPDPSDEPRGISGYTFALPGEPDLDRIIRFHDPVAPRSHGPEVGVHVRSVEVDGVVSKTHPIQNARIELLDEPRFESRNRLITDDRGGVGMIHPFHIRVSGRRFAFSREDILDPSQPDAPIYVVPVGLQNRRASTRLDGMDFDPLRIADATEIRDPLAFRRVRRLELQNDLKSENDPERKAALMKRIEELAIVDPRDLRVLSLGFVQTRRFEIDGPVRVDDPQRMMGGVIDEDGVWPIEFWMGGWDADSLCGFVSGVLEVPIRDG